MSILDKKKEALKQENPFYGLTTFEHLRKIVVNKALTENEFMKAVDAAWADVKTQEQKELFYVVLFETFDITNREHNEVKRRIKKIDNGGAAYREAGYWAFHWLVDRQYEQWLKFLKAGTFVTYSGWGFLLNNKVTTVKNTSNIDKVYTTFTPKTIEPIADYVSYCINTQPVEKLMLLAKHLTRPRLSTRKKIARKVRYLLLF